MKDRDIYRRVYQRLWRHQNFRALGPDEKVLALYLVTGPQTNLIGWYRFSPALAGEDIGATIAQVRKRLPAVLAAFDWEFDEASQLLWIRSWPKWNPPNGINQIKAWRSAISGMPSGETQQHILNAIGGNGEFREQ